WRDRRRRRRGRVRPRSWHASCVWSAVTRRIPVLVGVREVARTRCGGDVRKAMSEWGHGAARAFAEGSGCIGRAARERKRREADRGLPPGGRPFTAPLSRDSVPPPPPVERPPACPITRPP